MTGTASLIAQSEAEVTATVAAQEAELKRAGVLEARIAELEAERDALVRDCAQFVQNWNGLTRDGDTFLIAEAMREHFDAQLKAGGV